MQKNLSQLTAVNSNKYISLNLDDILHFYAPNRMSDDVQRKNKRTGEMEDVLQPLSWESISPFVSQNQYVFDVYNKEYNLNNGFPSCDSMSFGAPGRFCWTETAKPWEEFDIPSGVCRGVSECTVPDDIQKKSQAFLQQRGITVISPP